MGANERLTLTIDGKATGTAEIEKLAGALNKVVDISSRARNPEGGEAKTGFEGFPEKIKQLVEDPLNAAKSTISNFAGSFGVIGTVASGAVASLAAIGLASEEAARHLGELGVSVRDVSLKTGLSIKEVGQFGFAARAVGQEVGIFETGMRKLSQALADSGPDGDKARKALGDLGVITRDLNGELKPTSSIFLQIAEGLNHMGSAAERNATVVKIFGRGGIELIPVLRELNENAARAKELGFGLDEADVERYEKLKGKLTEIDTVWAGLKRKLEDGIVGKISFVFGEVRNAVAGFFLNESSSFNQAGGFGQGFGDLATDLVAPGLTGINRGLSGLAESNLPTLDVGSIARSRYGLTNPTADAFQTSASLAAGSSRIASAQSAYENTLPGASAAASKAKEAAAAAYTELLSARGAGDPAIRQKEEEFKRLSAVAQQYEERLKAISREEAKREGGANGTFYKEFQDKARSLSGVGADEFDRINSEYQAATSDDKLNYLSGDDRKTALEALKLARDRALSRLRAKLSEEGGKGLMENIHDESSLTPTLNRGRDAMAQLFGVDVTERGGVDAFDRQKLSTLIGIPRQATSEDLLRNLRDTSAHQERMINIGNEPGNEVATQQRLSDLRVSTAEKTYSLEKNLADLKGTEEEQEQAREDARIKYEQELFDVQASNIEKLAELRKQQTDREANLVTGLARSALSGGRGVTSYLKDFGVQTGETVLSNFVKSNPKILDSFFPHAKEGTTAGNLLKGTPFGPNANDASITLVNAGTSLQGAAADLSAAAGAIAQGGGFIPGGAVPTGSSPGYLAGLLGLGGGSGGIATYGSDINGLTGIPGLTESGGLTIEGGAGASNSPGVSVSSSPWSAGSAGAGASSGGGAGTDFGFNASTIGKAGATAAGVFGAVNGFSRGGGKGVAQGISSVAGTAAVWDPEPISKAVLAGVALVSGFIGSVLGDPKQLRQEAINKTIGNAKFEAPEAMNVSEGVNGGYSDYDAWGNVRSSNLSPYPTGVVDPSQWYYKGQYNQIPGSSGTPFGAPIVQIQGDVIDPQEFFNRNGTALANTTADQFGVHTALAMAATKATVVG